MNSLVCCDVRPKSKRYLEALALRNQVLRDPLGLVFTPEEEADEPLSLHLVAMLDDCVIGCLVLTPAQEEGVVRLRQFAVRPDLQGQGVGRQLGIYAEQFSVDKGFTRIMMYARASVTGFYVRLGYVQEGEAFEEIGIPHVVMAKALSR
jgi:predicted GNAT family N-acyltransferase